MNQTLELAVRSFSHNFFNTNRRGPAVVSRDHAVCLDAEHAERWGSLRLHELGDADAEGADPFSVQINNGFLGNRSTLAV